MILIQIKIENFFEKMLSLFCHVNFLSREIEIANGHFGIVYLFLNFLELFALSYKND